MKKAFLSLYFAILSLLLGCGVVKSFLRDFSLFDESFEAYLWPLLAALLFALSGLLFWIFGERMKNRKKV